MSDFLTPDSPQWEPMWRELATLTGDPAETCPDSGESWQYMGSNETEHQFRHRNRPADRPPILGHTGKHAGRVYLSLCRSTLRAVRVKASQPLDDRPSDYETPMRYTVKSSGPIQAGFADEHFATKAEALNRVKQCHCRTDDHHDIRPNRISLIDNETGKTVKSVCSAHLKTDASRRERRPEHYSGAFDGFHVTSDADPGL